MPRRCRPPSRPVRTQADGLASCETNIAKRDGSLSPRISLGLRAAEVESVVSACAEFCLGASRTPTIQTISVVLLMPPDAAWAWLSSDLQTRLPLEERAAVLSWARPLGEAGIEQWLASQGMIDTPDAVADVAVACGGWPDLLDWLKQHAGGNDLRDAIPQLADQLSDASSPLRTSFGDSLGLGSCSSARAAIGLVVQLPPASEADIADFLRSELRSAHQRVRQLSTSSCGWGWFTLMIAGSWWQTGSWA